MCVRAAARCAVVGVHAPTHARAQGFLLVYSITDDSTFDDLRDIHAQILAVHENKNVRGAALVTHARTRGLPAAPSLWCCVLSQNRNVYRPNAAARPLTVDGASVGAHAPRGRL